MDLLIYTYACHLALNLILRKLISAKIPKIDTQPNVMFTVINIVVLVH